MEMLSFGTLELRKVGHKVLIDGPSDYLVALNKFLELHDLRPVMRQNPQNQTIRLEIGPGRDLERVQALVDEWTS